MIFSQYKEKRLPIRLFKTLIFLCLVLVSGKVYASTLIYTETDSYNETVNLYDSGLFTITGQVDLSFRLSASSTISATGLLNPLTWPYDSVQNAGSANYGSSTLSFDICFNERLSGGCASNNPNWITVYIDSISNTVSSAGNNKTTRIISFSPSEGSTISGPAISFNLHAYINSNDVNFYSGVRVTLHNIDQNVLIIGVLSPNDIVLLDTNATTTGDFSFGTTTPIGDGNYRIEACLKKNFLGGILHSWGPDIYGLDTCQSHQFIVGAPTFIGNLSQTIYKDTQQFFASSTATSTQALANNCNPISGAFDIRLCSIYLIKPDPQNLKDTLGQYKDAVFRKFPVGYITRLYEIFSNTATGTLPSFTATIPMGRGDNVTPDTTTLTFDMGDIIAGGGALLDSIHDPYYGKTARDVFGPFVNLSVALSVLFTIVADVMRSHGHSNSRDGGESRRTKLS